MQRNEDEPAPALLFADALRWQSSLEDESLSAHLIGGRIMAKQVPS